MTVSVLLGRVVHGGRFSWRERSTRHLQLGQQESLNLCKALLPSREEIINKKQREHLFWSLKAAPLKVLPSERRFWKK